MKERAIYNIKYQYEGVNYEKNCTGYDFDVSVRGCLTMYFGSNNGRIIIPAYKISDFVVTCLWKN